MRGGGWPEGWGYGKKAVLGMVEALWSVKTAKGLNWIKKLPLAHDEAAYAMNFAWPSLKHMDDQGTIRSGTNIRPSSELSLGLATLLETLGDPYAAVSRGFAADVIATTVTTERLGPSSCTATPRCPGNSGPQALVLGIRSRSRRHALVLG